MRTIDHPRDPGTGNKQLRKQDHQYKMGSPKQMDMGMDLSHNATNARPISMKQESDTSKSHSRNQHSESGERGRDNDGDSDC